MILPIFDFITVEERRHPALDSGKSIDWEIVLGSVKKLDLNGPKDYFMVYLSDLHYAFAKNGAEKMMKIAEASGKDFVYFDLWRRDKDGHLTEWTLCDYQLGSVRDDFDFGEIVFIKSSALKKVKITKGLKYAGFYDVRLQICTPENVFHSTEMLYAVSEPDNRASGEKQFDYVAPNAREKQIEMERVCTKHLKRIGAYLSPTKKEKAETIANGKLSVVIPVKNRAKTIRDAVLSASNQKGVEYNIIVVDNHSDDGTSEILEELKTKVKNLVVLHPEQNDLQIGGCWMYAVNSEYCGDYAVQLDSDDVYSGDDTLLKIKNCFEETGAKMVIGAYDLTDFDLNPIPPGVIDHREWTDENGPNNALRINGLGAPRAFVRDELRLAPLPNVSYGEDYAAGLFFSRTFSIARIYDVLYHCRRWGGNSDSSLTPAKLKKNNEYKDGLRSAEMQERMKDNDK